MDNTAKPTGSVNNTTKASNAELWSSITSTWAAETRYWDELFSLIDNVSIAGEAIWSIRILPWRHSLPWQVSGTIMNNTPKP